MDKKEGNDRETIRASDIQALTGKSEQETMSSINTLLRKDILKAKYRKICLSCGEILKTFENLNTTTKDATEVGKSRCSNCLSLNSNSNVEYEVIYTLVDNIPIVDYSLVPQSWLDRCSGDGWETKFDKDGNRYYDDGTMKSEGLKPCKKCKEFPTLEEGHDSCLGELTTVMNACCGHGRNEGYIQFDNGKMLRGLFYLDNVEYNTEKERLLADIEKYKESIKIYEGLILRRQKAIDDM